MIPRRSSLPGDRGVLIVCNATHKTRKGFFFLLQVIEWWNPLVQVAVPATPVTMMCSIVCFHVVFACPATGSGLAGSSRAGGAGM